MKASNINGFHTLSTIGAINPPTPYRRRWHRSKMVVLTSKDRNDLL
jgi:hypothetical protein